MVSGQVLDKITGKINFDFGQNFRSFFFSFSEIFSETIVARSKNLLAQGSLGSKIDWPGLVLGQKKWARPRPNSVGCENKTNQNFQYKFESKNYFEPKGAVGRKLFSAGLFIIFHFKSHV